MKKLDELIARVPDLQAGAHIQARHDSGNDCFDMRLEAAYHEGFSQH